MAGGAYGVHRRGLALLVLLLALGACRPSEVGTPPPTQMLTPRPPTATAMPPTATDSLPPLPAPADLRPSPTAQGPLGGPSALQAQVIADLALYLSINPDLIEVLETAAVVWPNPQLACEERPQLVRAVEGYRFMLLAGNRIYEYHTDRGEQIRRCPQTGVLRGEQLIARDPVAAEMAALAQRQVAQDLDLSTRRVRLVDIYAVTWPDSSLGCPAADQNYQSVQIDGYRIVVIAGEAEYAFHTDSVMLVLCPAGRERLPFD